MSYQINLGEWNSVFAVPSSLVDKHMRLAGAVQLKVLLWVLRHAGEEFPVEKLAAAVGASPADTRDAMQYWVATGLLRETATGLVPPQKYRQKRIQKFPLEKLKQRLNRNPSQRKSRRNPGRCGWFPQCPSRRFSRKQSPHRKSSRPGASQNQTACSWPSASTNPRRSAF